MSRHNVRVRSKGSHDFFKKLSKNCVDVRQDNLNRFTKIVLEKHKNNEKPKQKHEKENDNEKQKTKSRRRRN